MRTRFHAVAGGDYFAAEKFPESSDVAAIVARLIDGRFENEGAAGKKRVIQDAAEGFEADFALTDMFVTIHARTVMGFRIVDVDDVYAIEADSAINRLQRGFESFGSAQIPSGRESMRGINANAEGKIGCRVQDGAQLFEARADGSSLPGRIFQQDFQVAEFQAARGLFQALRDGADGGGGRAFAAAAGMGDQIISAEGDGANEFLVKSLHGAGTQNRVWRREIDQVIIVDDQRAEAEFLAASAEARGFGFGDAGATALPHSRAAGKDLQGVGAKAMSNFERAGDVSRNRGMDANANAAVFPRGNFRGRRSFRAVLVGGVEGQDKSVVFFRHSLRVSGCRASAGRERRLMALRASLLKHLF